MDNEKRTAEVEMFLARVQGWAARRADVVAVGLVGSWAHGEARMDSDVDLVLLTAATADYLEDEAWVGELGGLRVVNTERWGLLTERRFVLPSGLEVEVRIVSPSWAATDPVDPGTRQVVEDGRRILYEPEGLLARLVGGHD